MGLILENGISRRVPVYMVDETDDESPETGLTLAVTISKNGAAFAATTNPAVEIGVGKYYVTLTTTELNTDGFLWITATSTGADRWEDYHEVRTTPATVNANVVSFAAGVLNKIADHVFRRPYASIRASADGDAITFRSPLGMLAQFLNRLTPNPLQDTQLQIFHEDDATLFHSRTRTTNPAAVPTVGIDTD